MFGIYERFRGGSIIISSIGGIFEVYPLIWGGVGICGASIIVRIIAGISSIIVSNHFVITIRGTNDVFFMGFLVLWAFLKY